MAETREFQAESKELLQFLLLKINNDLSYYLCYILYKDVILCLIKSY